MADLNVRRRRPLHTNHHNSQHHHNIEHTIAPSNPPLQFTWHSLWSTVIQSVVSLTMNNDKDRHHHDDNVDDPWLPLTTTLPLELQSNHDTHASISTQQHADSKLNSWQAGASLAKAILGAGSFALPWAFSQLGYFIGPLGMTVLLVASIHSLQRLVASARHCQRRHDHNNTSFLTATTSISYVTVAQTAFGTIGARLAYGASCAASLGVCGSYLLFVAATLQSLLPTLLPNTRVVIVAIVPVVVILSSVRNVQKFALVSVLGDVSVVLGMLVVLVYGILYRSSSLGQGCQAVGNLSAMPLALGNIGYLFLVHFLALPIESEMARPQHFDSVSRITFILCAFVSGGFGILGYLLFGEETQQIVLLNVEGSLFVSAVKLLLCIDLILTYPVVMRPTIVIVEQSLVEHTARNKRDDPSERLDTTGENVSENMTTAIDNATHLCVCLGLGLVTAAASMFVPAFAILSGLVGGVAQTFLAFVMPPLMLMRLRSDSHDQGRWFRMGKMDASLVSFGVTMIIWTSISTVWEITNDT